MQRLAAPSDANQLMDQLDPATELVTVDDAQLYDDRLVDVLNDLATIHRVDVVVAGWELDYTGRPAGPMAELMCAADVALKLDDGVCAQRFFAANGTPERFLPVCRRHHTAEPRAKAFQEVWFDEPSGSLDLISGCMFSGKTQELIRRLDQARYAGSTIQAFKPALDDRYAIAAVASHREVRFPAIAVPDVAALAEQVRDDTRVIGIDEAQFFGHEIVALVEELANRGRHLIVAGLDLDFLARPFGPMPLLAAYADRLTKLQASCQYPGCGSHQASRTQRLLDGVPAPVDGPLVVIGGAATYQARCRHHHRIGGPLRPEPEAVRVAEESADL
jgi:thymidine kinase